MRYSLFACALVVSGAVSAFAAVDPALLALVPSGARLVSGIQLDQARNSDFGQYLLHRIDVEDRSFREFTEETGFDPRRDLDEIVFASTGGAPDHSEAQFAILARGSFDPARIRAKAKAAGAVTESYRGVDLMVENHSERGATAFAFLEGGIAVMADSTTLRQIIANRNSPTPLDASLQDEIQRVSADDEAWFATSMPGSFLAHHMEHETKQSMQHAQVLQSIVVSSGGIHFGDVVAFSFDAKTRSPQDAVALADVFRFGGSMVQMQRQNDPRVGILASAIDKMNITTTGSSLHAEISITEKNLEQFVGVPAKTDFGGIVKQ